MISLFYSVPCLRWRASGVAPHISARQKGSNRPEQGMTLRLVQARGSVLWDLDLGFASVGKSAKMLKIIKRIRYDSGSRRQSPVNHIISRICFPRVWGEDREKYEERGVRDTAPWWIDVMLSGWRVIWMSEVQ